MLKIEQNWGKIANYPPNTQQRFAPLATRIPILGAPIYVTAILKIKTRKKSGLIWTVLIR